MREERLEELRDEALRTGSVRGAGVVAAGGPLPVASPETGYYGLPLLKPPVWTWEVPAYFFVGGAAGASAVVGAVADSVGGSRELARDARWIAAAGSVLSGGLLVSDLGRPERFLNMLRVFKPQSPMSVGAWTLAAFSTASSAALFADLVRERFPSLPVTVVSDAADLLAMATGLAMCTYTGVLIGATAIPVWNRSVDLLPVHFGVSALSSAVALLELMGHDDGALNLLGLMAAAGETAAGYHLESQTERALDPVKHGRSGWVTRLGGVLSGPVPLALRLFGWRSPELRQLAAWTSLAGALLTRIGWVEAGRLSAADPKVPLKLGGE